MKKAFFVGNRVHAFNVLSNRQHDYIIVRIFVIENSPLHEFLKSRDYSFELIDESLASKRRLFSAIRSAEFDIFISNGCPFLLPIEDLKNLKPLSLFVNIHPTYLPELRGKTPLNGVIFFQYDYVGATCHYIEKGLDSGNIIFQKRIPIGKEIDQGLIYFISFRLEGKVFQEALTILEDNDFKFSGTPQIGKGTHFNRDPDLFKFDISSETDFSICRKVNAVGLPNQGAFLEAQNMKYKVYQCEIISNNYLLEEFTDTNPGTIIHEYGNFLIVKSKEGLLKFMFTKIG